SLPNGSGTTSYVYEGSAVTVTDPAGKWKKQETDVFGNVVKTTEPNPAGGANWETTYTYNQIDQLIGVSMTRGSVTQTRTFAFDLGSLRLMWETHPESGTTTYQYNDDGTLRRKTLANGKQVNYGWDSLGRLGAINTDQICEGRSFEYDNASRNAMGRLWRVTYGSGSATCPVPVQFKEEYTYTASGNQTQKTVSLTDGGGLLAAFNVDYTFDNEGRMTSLKHGSVIDYNYGYDTLGRPSTMTGTVGVSGVTYNPADQITAMTHSGLVETRQYNFRNQLTRITVAGQMDVEYRYSGTQNNGQITQMKNWISGEEVTYTYDALSRLSAASTTGPEWGLSFGYDGFGNKVSQTVTKGTAPSMSVAVDGNNRVVGHTYDASGFPTAVAGTFTSLTSILS
ncbi:MAG: RHS repeat protein, partial [Bryobacterales bacterium]|nr:RHS repeat protein [Bryobacterales bacterium]